MFCNRARLLLEMKNMMNIKMLNFYVCLYKGTCTDYSNNNFRC